MEKRKGRTSRLTRELINELAHNVAQGFSYKVSAALAGVAESTFYYWLAKGKESKSGIFLDFLEEIKVAEQKAKVTTLEAIKEIAYGGRIIKKIQERRDEEGRLIGTIETTEQLAPSLAACCWMLERRWPEEFAPRSALEISNGKNPFQFAGTLFQQAVLPGSADHGPVDTDDSDE
ncbi:hypothetical protein Despr_2685 [Desulfobulbus propionicus DSM 2032]|uniref:Uncharacterized protein n=1 Tax=Desulfobulbus propionicus (strain ATCC 33891 / DSM 2032 / VKM B-1956 / 1pr3) TaxID=577650 RepID=A0A7U4DQ49_DESPD|nr:hypothetical protein [Desulfobulbus propionicus]ADW18821.1 hypothetical protein Despr_2685 [Desulfobulbus propionicus DSM 2032]